jgi:hypothetical protein
MRTRRNERGGIWVGIGIIALLIGLGALGKQLLHHASPKPVAVATATTSTPSLAVAAPGGTMSLQGTTVVARGKQYALTPVNGLTSPGSFAVEGTIAQVIPDPATVSQTPYYFVVRSNGGMALVGVVIPANDAKDFNASTFPVGTNILAAGIVFPAASPSAKVFDYGELLQALHVAPGLQGIGLPAGTPYIGVNFRDLGVLG